jgi:hypothetical protein
MEVQSDYETGRDAKSIAEQGKKKEIRRKFIDRHTE